MALSVAACGGGGGAGGPARSNTAAGATGSLKGLCPDPVVVQTSWAPQVEHAVVYQLLGAGYRVDADRKRVVGPLVSRGIDTGVRLEIRAGGPAIGFEQVSAQMYLDKTITIGMLATDEAVANSLRQPTTAVLAPFDVDPLMIMWDPKKHSSFNTIMDIGQTDTTVLYFQGESTYMDYLVGAGILRRRQVDGSWDGTPTRFIASRGAIAHQGFATAEPYKYLHEYPWHKPVAYQLVNDTGYPDYRNTLAVRAADKAALAPCLARLVPMLQRGLVDFMAQPRHTSDLILGLVGRYKLSYTDSPGRSAFSVAESRRQGFIGNGTNTTLGDFDPARIRRIIDITVPIYAGQNKPTKPGLTVADIATNEFVDPTVGLPR